MDETTTYTCPHCGEDILLPVDPSAGDDQSFSQDCPVCCRATEIRLTLDPEGRADARAAAEDR